MTHPTNRGMKPVLALAICAIMVFLTVGAGSAADDSSEDYHITALATNIGPCPSGPNWVKFGYDAKSSITFCMNRVSGPPSSSKESVTSLTYAITQIKGINATDASCDGKFGLGWSQWGWDGQAHLHYCEQVGNGRESTYLTNIITQLGEGCKVGVMSIYNGNSNISFCALSATLD